MQQFSSSASFCNPRIEFVKQMMLKKRNSSQQKTGTVCKLNISRIRLRTFIQIFSPAFDLPIISMTTIHIDIPVLFSKSSCSFKISCHTLTTTNSNIHNQNNDISPPIMSRVKLTGNKFNRINKFRDFCFFSVSLLMQVV